MTNIERNFKTINITKAKINTIVSILFSCLGDGVPPPDLRHGGLEPPELELPGEPLVLLHDPLTEEADVATARNLVVVGLLLMSTHSPCRQGLGGFWHRNLQQIGGRRVEFELLELSSFPLLL